MATAPPPPPYPKITTPPAPRALVTTLLTPGPADLKPWPGRPGTAPGLPVLAGPGRPADLLVVQEASSSTARTTARRQARTGRVRPSPVTARCAGLIRLLPGSAAPRSATPRSTAPRIGRLDGAGPQRRVEAGQQPDHRAGDGSSQYDPRIQQRGPAVVNRYCQHGRDAKAGPDQP